MPNRGSGTAESAGQSEFGSRIPHPRELTAMSADDVLQQLFEPDGGGVLHWRRRNSTTSPVLEVTDKYIVGDLDLRALDYPYLLRFLRCQFERPPDLRQAKFGGCHFHECVIPGIAARNLRSDSDLMVADSRVEGHFDLTDANISGSLDLHGSELLNPTGRALQADRLVIAGALLGADLTVRGGLRLAGVRTGGNISLAGANLRNDTGLALDGPSLQAGGNLIWDSSEESGRPFTCTGLIFVPSARVESDLYLRGAVLKPSEYRSPFNPHEDPEHDPVAVLVADRSNVLGNVTLDRELSCTGTLRFVNAHIGGSLRMTDAEVDVSGYAEGGKPPYEYRALHFDGTEIRGDVDLRRAVITGESRVADVSVRGSIFSDYATFSNPEGAAIEGRRLEVGGSAEFRDVTIAGSMLLPGAKIDANLDLRATKMTNPARRIRGRFKSSLDIRAAYIGRDLICAAGRKPFTVHGGVRLHRATIAREANFAGAVLESSASTVAFNGFGMTSQELILTMGKPPVGEVILRHARCNTLADNKEFWNATNPIDLEDFRYDALAEPIGLREDRKVKVRLRWLRMAMRDKYRPGPYDQLAAMLRESGNEEHASTVLMSKQYWRYRALARGYRIAGPAVLVWSWLQRWMVGYGYRPMRALGWLIGLLAFGTMWFGMHSEVCRFQPIGTLVAGHCSVSNDDTGLVWNPFLYTLDLLVPIVDFGNKGRWHTQGLDLWMSSAFISAGWILATNVAAGLTNVIRRQ